MFHMKVLFLSKNDLTSDPILMKLVKEQTQQWSELQERHRKEEWELLRQHVIDQQEILKKLMKATQTAQLKQIEVKHER